MRTPYLFLLPLTVALLSGCGPASQEEKATQATRPPQSAAGPGPTTAAPDSGGRAAIPAAGSTAGSGRPERLVLLPVGPDIGPQPLECDTIGQAELPRQKNGLPRGEFYWGGRLLLTRGIGNHDGDSLLLRYNPRDTTWLHLPLSVPDDYHSSEPRYLEVQLVNLDQQGPPEVLVYFSDESYGGGGGTSRRMLNVFALDPNQPRRLLRVMVSSQDESHPSSGGARSTTTERTVRLRGRDIELGAPKSSATGTAVAPQSLPGPPPGRYRYQRGRLYRVEAGR